MPPRTRSRTTTSTPTSVRMGPDRRRVPGPSAGNTVTGATDNVSGGEAYYGDGIQIDSTTTPGVGDGQRRDRVRRERHRHAGSEQRHPAPEHDQRQCRRRYRPRGPAPNSASTTPSSNDTASANTAKRNRARRDPGGDRHDRQHHRREHGEEQPSLRPRGPWQRKQWTSNTCKPAQRLEPQRSLLLGRSSAAHQPLSIAGKGSPGLPWSGDPLLCLERRGRFCESQERLKSS